MRALIISVDLGNPDFTAHTEEFAMLARGAGAEIVGTVTVRRDRPDAKFFIGSGKVQEAVAMAGALLADIVLFDQPLSPRSEEHTSELQSLMRSSYAVFCLKKNTTIIYQNYTKRPPPKDIS